MGLTDWTSVLDTGHNGADAAQCFGAGKGLRKDGSGTLFPLHRNPSKFLELGKLQYLRMNKGSNGFKLISDGGC